MSIHHVAGVADLIESRVGAQLLFPPPNSPDLNPAEEVFSKIKGIMKQNDALFRAGNEPGVFLTTAYGIW